MAMKAENEAHANVSVDANTRARGETFAIACFAAIDHLRVALDASPDTRSRAEVLKALQAASEALDLTLTPKAAKAPVS